MLISTKLRVKNFPIVKVPKYVSSFSKSKPLFFLIMKNEEGQKEPARKKRVGEKVEEKGGCF